MKIRDKVVVVTGGGSGIGRALCRSFFAGGAKAIVVADRNGDAAKKTAEEIGGLAATVDAVKEADIKGLVETAINNFGPIDLFCSNAGIIKTGGCEAADVDWQLSWDLHVMAHVYAARAVLPSMLERGAGYLLQTVSAAGLLTTPGAAPYSVTKHASLAFGEYLSMAHGSQGIKVSCLCPQGVRTGMLTRETGGIGRFLMPNSLSAEQVAQCALEGIEREEFLILPHSEVKDYFQKKAKDYEGWLRGMRRLHKQYVDS